VLDGIASPSVSNASKTKTPQTSLPAEMNMSKVPFPERLEKTKKTSSSINSLRS
jgi:hypothetical protein